MNDGAGLSPGERHGLRLRVTAEARKRSEELVFVGPWQVLLRSLSSERALTHAMLAARCGWKLEFLAGQFFSRWAPRAPSGEEAQRLAQALNLRGGEKLEFLRLAKEARELVAKKRAAPTAAAREAILNAHAVGT